MTGVEMEALTATSVAALTVYDMCKAISKVRGPSELAMLAYGGVSRALHETVHAASTGPKQTTAPV